MKTFLTWCYDMNYIDRVPKIVMFLREQQNPKPFTESQINSILTLDSLTDFFIEIFKLYLELGIRLGEGVKGQIEGNFLIIASKDSKTKKER